MSKAGYCSDAFELQPRIDAVDIFLCSRQAFAKATLKAKIPDMRRVVHREGVPRPCLAVPWRDRAGNLTLTGSTRDRKSKSGFSFAKGWEITTVSVMAFPRPHDTRFLDNADRFTITSRNRKKYCRRDSATHNPEVQRNSCPSRFGLNRKPQLTQTHSLTFAKPDA